MPIYTNMKMGPRPKNRFKPCPNCGSDVEHSLKDCCVQNRTVRHRSRNRPRIKSTSPFLCMNPADEGKYELRRANVQA